jgi:ATP phosphoribosyltransferase
MLELIEARMHARNRSLLTVSLIADSQQALQQHVQRLNQRLQLLQADIELRITSLEPERRDSDGSCWYTLSGVIGIKGEEASRLLEIVAALRLAGATDINITPLTYRFKDESLNVRALRERLQRYH